MPITIVVIDIRSRTIFFVLPYTTTGSMIFLIENWCRFMVRRLQPSNTSIFDFMDK